MKYISYQVIYVHPSLENIHSSTTIVRCFRLIFFFAFLFYGSFETFTMPINRIQASKGLAYRVMWKRYWNSADVRLWSCLRWSIQSSDERRTFHNSRRNIENVTSLVLVRTNQTNNKHTPTPKCIYFIRVHLFLLGPIGHLLAHLILCEGIFTRSSFTHCFIISHTSWGARSTSFQPRSRRAAHRTVFTQRYHLDRTAAIALHSHCFCHSFSLSCSLHAEDKHKNQPK